MSDEENNVSETTAETDKQNLIGVDPLAWLSDEEKAAMDEQQNEAAIATDVEQVTATSEAQSGTTYTVKLDSALTIRDISELLEELNNISEDKNELIFDSEQVERVDAAAIQLLVGFYLFAIDAGKKVVWNKPSEAFCSGVKLLGLDEIINLTAVSA